MATAAMVRRPLATAATENRLARAAWGPGFTFSTVEALRNPMAWRQFSEQWQPMLRQPVIVALTASWISSYDNRVI